MLVTVFIQGTLWQLLAHIWELLISQKSLLLKHSCISAKHQLSCKNHTLYIFDIAGLLTDNLTLIGQAFNLQKPMQDTDDKVFNYGRVMCHFASLLIEFIDACREVDGKRVIRCWRLFLPHFYVARRTKYALEALNIQMQLKVLSPQLSHELTWSRFVNTHGDLGNNISCDLANEHINKQIKEIVANMGQTFQKKHSRELHVQ